MIFNDINNTPENFDKLFAIHEGLGFDGNLLRLVDATNSIKPTGTKFFIGNKEKEVILNSVERAISFLSTSNYRNLKQDLDKRLNSYRTEILIASHIENTNLRGRLIEYFITEDDIELKKKLSTEIKKEYKNLPKFKTENELGDYIKDFNGYHTATDIKTKIMVAHNSNPKGYNIDKMLNFLSLESSVFLFYFIGIDISEISNTVLTSMFQKDILDSTILLKHWSGRNSIGVTQLEGTSINKILSNPNNDINTKYGQKFLIDLISIS